MGNERLCHALVEVGTTSGAGLAGVQEHKGDAALAENLAYRAFTEQVFASPRVFKNERTLLGLVVEHTMPDEVYNSEATHGQSGMDPTRRGARQHLYFGQPRVDERIEAAADNLEFLVEGEAAKARWLGGCHQD